MRDIYLGTASGGNYYKHCYPKTIKAAATAHDFITLSVIVDISNLYEHIIYPVFRKHIFSDFEFFVTLFSMHGVFICISHKFWI